MTGWSLALHVAFALVAVGFGAAVTRRHVVVVVMGLACASLGGVFALIIAGMLKNDARLIGGAMVALLVVAAFCASAVAVALATYRRRGTDNLDELTELSG